MANYRNHLLLGLAAKAPHCMVPGCGAANRGQIVSMHSNRSCDGKAMGMKASDAAIAFGCEVCHRIIDQGAQDGVVRLEMWEAAHRATMRWLIESGHLVPSVEPVAPPPPKPKPKAKINPGAKLQGRPFQKPDKPHVWPKRSFPKRTKP